MKRPNPLPMLCSALAWSALLAVVAPARAQNADATASASAGTSTSSSAAPAAPANPTASSGNPADTGTISSSASPAPTPPARHASHRLLFGPEVGLYIPTDSKTRDRFGSTWFSIGLGIGDIIPARPGGAIGLDLNLIGQTGSGKHAWLAPIGLQYRQALTRAASPDSSVPYVGVSGDLVLTDIRSSKDNAHSGVRTTGGGSAFIGTTLGPRSYVEARYIAVGSVQHFNLSGFDLTAGVRF